MFNILSEKSHSFAKSFDEWTRILHISTISHVIAPATVPNTSTRQNKPTFMLYRISANTTNIADTANMYKDHTDGMGYYRH